MSSGTGRGQRVRNKVSQLTTVRPEGWARAGGYSYVVVESVGRRINIAGQLPWDPVTQTCVDGDFAAQWDQALANLAAVVRAAGGEATDICELVMYITSMQEYLDSRDQLGASWMRHIGKHFPAMTIVEITRLIDPQAKLEVRGTAAIA
ncbi:RidA family protein [Rhodococcus sp. NPDC057014]|uniref:RidA family protein n=1 Tax=Rhodococcus sp. NPDC057014 TaxID=3346000 RepID=UPI003632481B